MLTHWTNNTYVWFQSAVPAFSYAVLKDRFTPTRAIVVILAVALWLLNVYDLIITRLVLAIGGVEANPLMVDIVESYWGVVLKVGFVGLIALSFALRKPIRKTGMGLAVVVGVYVAVVILNTITYFGYLT